MSVDQDIFVLVPNPNLLGVVDVVPLVEFVVALSEHDSLVEAIDDAAIDMAHDARGLGKMIEKIRVFNDSGDLYAFHGITPPEAPPAVPSERTAEAERADG